jgi:hypothetical protein
MRKKPDVKVCSHRCKKAPWTCWECGRKTCEHLCSLKKNDGTALCGKTECRNAGRLRFIARLKAERAGTTDEKKST